MNAKYDSIDETRNYNFLKKGVQKILKDFYLAVMAAILNYSSEVFIY